jgi:hypothetical protein
MKKILLFLSAVLFVSITSHAQSQASPLVSSSSDNIKISYSQPSKKGREIFGTLVPYDQVWRTGANMGTEITFFKDVNFGGKSVKAGTYTLFTIPGANEWTVILNPELKQQGSSNYGSIKEKNIAEVKVKPTKTSAVQEKLLINSDNTSLTITWDMTSVSVPLKF